MHTGACAYYVVRSVAHTIESTSGVQVTWHSSPAVHILCVCVCM